jgi:ABC-type nitrate/sulfonate/bicarbonate transport system permease component
MYYIKKNIKKKLILFICIVILVFIWELTANHYPDFKYFVSCPTDSLKYAFHNYENILNSTFITSTEAISGLIIAIIFSFIVMFFCLLYPPILEIILPFFVTSQILPIITLAPLFIVLFGMGIMSKIAMVVLMCFFPIFINFSSGVKSISKEIHELLYVYHAGKMFRIFKIYIPLSTSYVFSGLKISTTMAIMGAIVAEFVGAKDGLGKNLYLAPKFSLPELMICSIFIIILLGWLLFKCVELIEQKLGKWYLENSPKEK